MNAATSKAPKKRSTAKRSVDQVLAQERAEVLAQERAEERAEELAQALARAEERGAEGVRDQLRGLVEEHRRVVRVRNQQVEVVETAALGEILEDH